MTRGWEVLAWSHRYLPSPSDPSQPLVLSDEQAAFLIAFYELDEHGVYVYRRGALEASKGWGKSPLGAIVCLAEFCGPVAATVPWVQIAACSEDQAVSNVYSLIWSMLSENDAQAARELGIDLGRGRLYLKAKPGAKLEAVSSSWGAREGQRLTFGALDESHNFTKSNGGHRLARVLRRNAAKMDGRTLELANAPELGEDSVAEQTEAAYLAGEPGILFEAKRPSVEPTPEMDDEELRRLISEVYAGATDWVDLDRILREVRDPGAPWSETARFFFNYPSSGTLAAVEATVWDALAAPRELEAGEQVCLGFDGSDTRAATALVGCTLDGYLFLVELLERPANVDEWRVDRARVARAVEQAFETYDVQALYCDPWGWRDEQAAWAERWGEEKVLAVPWNSVTRAAPIVDRFRTALAEGRISHSGDNDFRRHVLNARLRKVGRDEAGLGRYTFEAAGPGRLFDACVASCLAYEAVAQTPEPVAPFAMTWAS
jgi:hypothetical protein